MDDDNDDVPNNHSLNNCIFLFHSNQLLLLYFKKKHVKREARIRAANIYIRSSKFFNKYLVTVSYGISVVNCDMLEWFPTL